MTDETRLVRAAHKGGSPSVFHTDPDCDRIVETARPVSEEHVERRGLRECRFCAGEVDTDRSKQYRPLRLRIEQGEVEV